MRPGRYHNISNEDYHAAKGLSNTTLGHMQTRGHYEAYLAQEFEQTAAMRFGSAMHMGMLQPALYESTYVINPDWSKNSNQHKEWRAAQEDAGRICIDRKDADAIECMRHVFWQHPKTKSLLKGAIFEESFWWKEDGLLMKCRPDIRDPNRRILWDAKSCPDAAPGKFARDAHKFQYARQSKHYLAGVSAVEGEPYESFGFIAIEKKPPYTPMFYLLDAADIDQGEVLRNEAIKKYKEYQKKTDEWWGYSADVETLTLPDWRYDNG